MRLSLPFLLVITIVGLALSGCGKPAAVTVDAQSELRLFLQEFETRVIPLSKDAALAGFESSISGKDEDYKRGDTLPRSPTPC
jgi:hypothetical protein